MTESKPTITGTMHALPFDKLSPHDFERLCLWLVEREGYERAEHLGAAGSDQGRDIKAWRKGQLWVFQCKRVQRFGPASALKEVEKILALREDQRPYGLLFLVTCNVRGEARRQARELCAREKIKCEFWTGTELDEKVKRHPGILKEFFLLPSSLPSHMYIASPQESSATWQDIVIVGLGIVYLLPAIVSWLGQLKPKKRRAVGFPVSSQTHSASNGVKLLRHHLSRRRATDADLESLARDLDHHPLALKLAGCYLERIPHLSVDDHLKQLKEVRNLLPMDEWRERMGTSAGRELDVVAAFVLSWEQVKSDPARRIFLLAGYCAPNQPIPHILLQQAAELEKTKIYERALDMLVGLGLLEVEDTETGPLIHPLLAECAKSLVLEIPVPLLRLVSTLSTSTDEISQISFSDSFAALRPHVEAVATAAQDVGLERAGELWSNLGSYLRTVGDYAGARNAFERAGMALRDVGDLSQAAVLFLEVLELDRQLHEPDPANLARDFNNLAMVLRDAESYPNLARELGGIGTVLRDMGNLAKARRLLEDALEYDRPFCGPDHPNVARDFRNLGVVLRDMEHLDQARAMFEQALRIDQESYGPNHPSTARDLENLGLVSRDMGRLAHKRGHAEKAQAFFVDARGCLWQALAIWRAAYGEEHPQVAMALTNLGMVFQDQKDWRAAREAFEQALTIWCTVYGKAHPQVAEAHSNIGNLLRDLEDLNGARAAFEQAIAILQASYGEEHPRVATVYSNLGMALQDLGDLDSAREAFEQALTILQAAYGEQHPQVAITHNNIGRVMQKQGKLDSARQAYKQALNILDRPPLSDHPYTAIVKWNLESLTYDLGCEFPCYKL